MNGTATRRNAGVSGLNVVLGIWLIVSPFVLGFTRNNVAEWNNIAAGIAVALVALAGLSWLNVVLGIWLIISPFVLAFSGEPAALWNNVIIGALVAILALISAGARSADTDLRTPPPA